MLVLELLVIRTDASEVGTIRVLLLLALISDDGSSITLDVTVPTLLIDVAEHTPQLGQRQALTSGSRPLAELPIAPAEGAEWSAASGSIPTFASSRRRR